MNLHSYVPNDDGKRTNRLTATIALPCETAGSLDHVSPTVCRAYGP